MKMTGDLGRAGSVLRVRHVDDDAERAYVELTNGSTATVDGEVVLGWRPGDVLLATADGDRTSFDHAPDELWPHDAVWVGVVRLRREDITVVEVGGGHRRVPTNDVPYGEGNTVEGRDSGVIRVLSERPIRYLDLAQDDVDVEHFVQATEALPTFEDFGGLPDVKARARELIETPLRHRAALDAIGARPVKGVLFTGGPGTGKTMLARIIAGAAGATFYRISGPEIVSKWYGESEKVLRAVFDHASRQERSIIFFDEIDSVAAPRSGDAHEASKRLVAQLLTEMDGFEAQGNIVVIAATNRPQDIDVALLRPGRFDWTIEFPLPSQADRVAILSATAAGLATHGPLPHDVVAARTEGWSGAELTAVFSEAALLAVTDERQVLMPEDYLGGVERVAAQRAKAAAGRGRAAP
jgi:transitional endoplasmic reticulum ATPase